MTKNNFICDCEVIHPQAVAQARRHRPDQHTLQALTQLFKILGDATRTQILCILDRNELCVCDIANVLNMSKSAVSHQLAILRQNKVVKSRRVGKEVYYVLDDEHIAQLYEIGLAHIKELKTTS